MIYESDEQNNKKQQQINEQWGQNVFLLSQQQKNNLNKRLPRGFCLIRKQQYEKLDYTRKSTINNIIYQPVKIQRLADFDESVGKGVDEQWNNKKMDETKRNNRFTLLTSVEGKTRQSEKIKNIIQRFRKLIKNTQVQIYLNKVGLMNQLNQIQQQNKRGMLNIDIFKSRYMAVLERAKVSTFKIEVSNQIDEMIQQFICYVEQARKAQFESNIQSIQKSIDKITRYLSQTIDIKSQGNWYIRKKKKIERNQNYNEKQILYIGQLIKKLPYAYLIGIWQIINQKPFIEGQKNIEYININEIGYKKLKDIEIYVKNKLLQIYKSRQNKKQKIEQKKKQKQQKHKIQQQQQLYLSKQQNKPSYHIFQKSQNPLDLFVHDQDNSLEQQNDDICKKQVDIPQQIVFQVIQNLGKSSKNQKEHKDYENENKCIVKYDQLNSSKKYQNNMVPVDVNNSSDSSMITDEDDSDF